METASASSPKQIQLEKSQILFREGDPANDFLVLLTGKLAVFRRKQYVRSILGRGVFVGEMGTLLGFKRSATVIALEKSSLMTIPNSVDKIFLHHHEIGDKLIENLRRRISETYDRAVKLWATIRDDVIEIVVYEVTTKKAATKRLAMDQVEAERTSVRKLVHLEMDSEKFDFGNMEEFLQKMDIQTEFHRHLNEKYPRYKYLNLDEMRALWKKRSPDDRADKLKFCIDFANGLNQLTDFLTSFGVQDEEPNPEEIEMLESSLPLPRRSAILKAAVQRILTPKLGIDKMKVTNRDVDTELEEANRSETKTGRLYLLTEFAHKLNVGPAYLDDLRKEFWNASMNS